MEIWRDIIENGDSGVERLVSEYGDRLLAAASLLRRGDADAEDLAFRALERAVQRIRSYRPTGSFFAWLYAILLNLHRMDARRRRAVSLRPWQGAILLLGYLIYTAWIVRIPGTGHTYQGKAAQTAREIAELVRRWRVGTPERRAGLAATVPSW